MRKNLIKILLILLLVLLQLSFFSKISFWGMIPNLIYLLSISLLLRGFFRDSLMVTFWGGIFLDLVSPLRFGIFTLLLLLVLIFLQFIFLKNIPAPNPLLVFLIIFCIFLFTNFIIFLIIKNISLWQIILDAIINSCWGEVLYLILGKIIKPSEEIKLG